MSTILVAQADGIVDNLSKVRMAGGLTVACKGQHVRQLPLSRHLLQFGLQLFCYQFTCRTGQRGAVVFIQTALAIDTVEGADLTVGRHEVDAERYAQTATVNGAEDGRWIDNCTHNGCKGTKKNEKIWISI